MKLKDYNNIIIQSMQHFNELTNFDIMWLSETYERIYTTTNHPVPMELDFSNEDIIKIEELCYKDEEIKFCCASTTAQLEFIFIPMKFEQEKKGLIKIGPFIMNPMNNMTLSKLLFSLNLPLRFHKTIHSFYDELSVIPNHYVNNLGHIGMNLFGQKLTTTKKVNYQTKHLTVNRAKKHYLETEQSKIEKRYAYEKQLREAVAKGDYKQLQKIRDYFEGNISFRDRFPENPLRSEKNISIVRNTILRISAENGGLNPIYLHELSDKYARLIERASTHTALDQIKENMFKEYTETVKLHAYPTASPFIKKVIDKIKLNLDQQLTVTTLATEFGVKPSNLSNLFKKATNKTVSEFIHDCRIQESIYYLEHFDLSISEISQLVGYPDQNYFTRIFKKHHNMSPTQYKKNF